MKETLLRDTQIRNIHELGKMKRVQELRVDKFSVQKLRESHETIQRLTSQLQSVQEEMNSDPMRAPGNVSLPRRMQSPHDGEAMGTLHNGACEDDRAQPCETSCGSDRLQFAPSNRSQSVPTALIWDRVRPGSIAKDIAKRASTILGLVGWQRVCNLGPHACCQQSIAPIPDPFAMARVAHDACTRPTLVWIAGAGWDAPTNPTISAITTNVRASGRAPPLFGGWPALG